MEALYIVFSIEAMKKIIYTEEGDLLRKWLTQKRHESNLSQRKFALLLGVSYSIVAKVEIGERQLRMIEFIEYCIALDTDYREIMEQLELVLRTNNSKISDRKVN